MSTGADAFAELRERLATVADLNAAQAVLSWDQETYMPSAAVESRAHQMATLGRASHDAFTASEVGELLERAARQVAGEDPDSDAVRLVNVARRDYDRATRLPARLVADLAQATARAQHAWKNAREASDFAMFRPHLERLLELTLEKAEAFGYEENVYDALLDEYEPGMSSTRVTEVFGQLRDGLVPLVAAIADRPQTDASCLYRNYPEVQQWDFGLSVIRDFGFDFERGRQDRSAHPFSTNFAIDDVRITTRVVEDFLPSCLFGTLHEAGHAMYEQGVAPELGRSPLANGTSLGVHESQSRLWENQVGRSLPFWRHYFPKLQSQFPEQLADVDLEAFYRAVNRVEPSLVRVEADEVTYNLHIMVRFELETELVAGRLAVKDLPDAWNARYVDYLGIAPGDDAEGVLQDIHWSIAAIGYFPTYTLGNVISAQLFEAIRDDLPDLDAAIARGDFAELLQWLRERIHRHGRKFTADELLRAVCGGGLDAAPWLTYVRDKFGAIYGL